MNYLVRLSSYAGILIALLSLVASLTGIFHEPLYDDAFDAGVFPEELHPGTFSQDLITVVVAFGLLVLSIFHLLGEPNIQTRVTHLAFLGYILYGYALLTIGGTFTFLYPVYVMILGTSIYTLIISVMSFEREEISSIELPEVSRKGMIFYLLLVAVAFNFLWFAMLIPASIDNERIETYPVFIMDLCVVMPFFVITAFLLLKRKPLGNLLMGVALVKILTLILSVVIGESLASRYDMEPNYPMIGIYSIVLLISLLLTISYFRAIRRNAPG